MIRGQDNLSSYQAPLLREPPAYRRDFCRTCGCPMPVPLGDTDFMVIQAGALDGEIKAKVFRHIFTNQAAGWYAFDDDLRKFEQRPPPTGRVPADEDMKY